MQFNPKGTQMFLLLAMLAISALGVTAQKQVWSENDQNRASITTNKAVARQSFPEDFKLFNLNIEPLRQQLLSIVDGRSSRNSTVITLPNADGKMELFEVYEASNFEPDLQVQFPEIRAYSGIGITDRYATLKLSLSPQGIQTMVFRTDSLNEFIEPYSQDGTIYAAFRSSRSKGELPWACTTHDQNFFDGMGEKFGIFDEPISNEGKLRTMRLAQSNNGEYANYFGASTSGTPADQAIVLAAFNATLTRANGVYERDLALHLNLVAQTVNVIYYDPATDPYTTLSNWNNQLQTALTANVGEANYDIGHMFGASGGGGNAGCIGCVCSDGQKGRGITSPADGIPQGDNFDIDYVAHEVGHQLGANHTFSMSSEGTGRNKEVGSGITVMGYAGITSQDVAPHSIDVFHQTSIEQIQANLITRPCPVVTTMTANGPPVIAPIGNFTIPISTPFQLTGSATDPEGDAITYNWEQNDNSTTTGAASVASPTKLTGPNWLTFPSTASPTRMFPRLSTILAGLAVTPPLPGGDAGANIEALSSVTRTLNFRLTARDNKPYVPGSTIGQTQFADSVVTVTNTAGPFKVTAPNTGVFWAATSTKTVTWDVANTTAAPINTANVKITMSTDGGNTFPIVLAETTPNDGSRDIVVPNTQTTTGRVKIESIGNIFFDISDANFTIIPNAPFITSGGPGAITAESCPPANNSLDPGENVTVNFPILNSGAQNTSNLVGTLLATGGVTNPSAPQNYGVAVAGGAAVTRPFTFKVDPSMICGNTVTATLQMQDGATDLGTVTFTFTTGVQAINLSQNFDGVTAPALPAGWTMNQTSGTGITWTTSTTSPNSAPNTAFAPDPASINAAALESPVFPVSVPNASLTFQKAYTTENTFDGAVLEIKIGSGAWTDIVAAGGVFVSGGYTGTISTSWGSPIGGRMAWTGTSASFTPSEVTLPAAANGQNVQLRWLMASDSSVASVGFRLDDVSVSAGVICSSCTSSVRSPFDFDGDGKSDVSIFRPSVGEWWYLRSSDSTSRALQFGQGTEKIASADYTGDGKTDVAFWRPTTGEWFILRSEDQSFYSFAFGASGDIPAPADYDGDGKADPAIFRPSNSTWYILKSSGGTIITTFGTSGDRPVAADYDGDGKADLGVFRPSTGEWWINRSLSGIFVATFGSSTDKTVQGDYTGDGKADIAFFRPSSNEWFILRSENQSFYSFPFGTSGDLPVPGDFDGDGKIDPSVFRPSNNVWYKLQSTAGFEAITFGVSGDTPVPNAFVR